MLATEPPESKGIVNGDQVWLKFPNGELLALEIDNSDQLSNLLDKASCRSATIGPTNDVYATCEGKPIDPRVSLRTQNVKEGSYARIHYRLGAGSNEAGKSAIASCSYGMRCLFSHDTSRICCTVRGCEDHVQEERVCYGGGSYNPQLDPNALKEAERAALHLSLY